MANRGGYDGLVRPLFLKSSPTSLVGYLNAHHLPFRSAGRGIAGSMFPVGGDHEGERVPLKFRYESYVPVLQEVHVEGICPPGVHKDSAEWEVVLRSGNCPFQSFAELRVLILRVHVYREATEVDAAHIVRGPAGDIVYGSGVE